MANSKEFDFMKMFYDIRQVCMGEEVCGACTDMDCLVGYARQCIGKAKKNDTDNLPGEYTNIPLCDTKGSYDMNFAMEAIAHTLQQCKSCKDFHNVDCLVNIIRSCYEVIVFGEEREYPGSAFVYLSKLSAEHPEIAAYISEIYRNHGNQVDELLK